MNNSEYIDFCPTECGWEKIEHYAYKRGYYTWGAFQMMKLTGPAITDIPIYRIWTKHDDEDFNRETYNGPLNKTMLHEIMKAIDAMTKLYA